MPVATSTMTHNLPDFSPVSALKSAAVNAVEIQPEISSKDLNSKQSRALEKIYNRAARAFLNRNIVLTHELLEAGFKNLESGIVIIPILRKWDILRITFDTMLYTSPPDSKANGIHSLNDLRSKTPHSFVEDMYNRSLKLFKQAEENAVLPSQVLSTLVYSSLKTDAPDVGRRMVEDWLAGRGDSLASSWMSSSSSSTDYSDGYDADNSVNGDNPSISPIEGSDGYSKILELYCLQVLPKLEQWEYAAEFLEYESELDPQVRDTLKRSLQSLHAQTVASRLPSPNSSFLSSGLSPSPGAGARAYSPAPSASSSSSSLSTTSTHTAVPATPRARLPIQGLPSGSTNEISEGGSESTGGTITPRQRTGFTRSGSSKGKSKQRTPRVSTPPSSAFGSGVNAHPLNSNALTPLSLPKTHLNSPSAQGRQNPTTTFALIKASIVPYLGQFSSANKIASLMAIFIAVPVFSLFVQILRRRHRLPGGSSTSRFGVGAGSTSADLVRQRLQAVNANASVMGALGGLLAKAWWEIIRVVLDTIKMGGSGLV